MADSAFWVFAKLHFAGCIFTFFCYVILFSVTHWKQYFDRV